MFVIFMACPLFPFQAGAVSLRRRDQHAKRDFAPRGPQFTCAGGRRFTCSRRALLTVGSGALFMAGAARAGEDPVMPHAVLLGDSIFDNAAYVGGGPDVIRQLRERLPEGWRASLAAVNGGTMSDIDRQLDRLPADATHLVVSVGGNDALGQAGILDAPSRSVADTLLRLADIQQAFRAAYSRMIEAVVARMLPAAFCTIYDPRYPDPIRRRVAATALAILNDCILREAAIRGLPIIDLRVVCNEDADFANPIEPSVQGGAKIAAVIASLLTQRDFGLARSEIFTR
jgi:hypothetical protein